MNPKTVKKLVDLNTSFYQNIGEYFDSSRNYFWPGWERLVSIVENELLSSLRRQGSNAKGGDKTDSCLRRNDKVTLKVLDLGCGNARFLEFLYEKFSGVHIDYYGVDSSQILLDKAKERMDKFRNSDDEVRELINSDILFDNWEVSLPKEFDLIVMFGVMHHIPGLDNRIELINKSSNLLSQNGLLAVAYWRFMDNERILKRVVNPQNEDGKDIYSKLDLKPDEFEANDYILDWQRGKRAFRYCHYVDNSEAELINSKNNLAIVDKYRADGKEEDVNGYYVLKIKN